MKKSHYVELSPEEHFLLVASRYQLTKHESEESIILAKKIENWQALLELIKKHSVGPIIFKNFEDYTSIFPKEVFQFLQESYYSNHIYAWQRLEHLKRIVAQLNQLSIFPVLLKGIAMANFYYSDPALRPMADIDILVEKHQLRTVEEVLLENGGKREHQQKQEYIRAETTNQLLPIFFEEINCVYDVHFELLPPPPPLNFRYSSIKKQLKNIWLEKANARILNSNNSLLFSILHNFKNIKENFSSLLWCNDLRAIQFENYVNQLITQFPSFRSEIEEHFMFYKQYFQEIRIERTGSSRLVHTLFRGKNGHNSHEGFIYELCATKGWKNTAKKVFLYAFPSSQYMLQKYALNKKWKIWPYYFIRLTVGLKHIIVFYFNTLWPRK